VSRRYIILRFQSKGYFIKSIILVSYYDKEVNNMNITNEVKEIILELPKNMLFNSKEIYERYFIDFCMESTYLKIINRMQKMN